MTTKADLALNTALQMGGLHSKLLTFQMKQAHTMHLLMACENEYSTLAHDHLNPDGGEYAPHTVRDHSKQMGQLESQIKAYRMDLKLVMQNAEAVQRQVDELVHVATSCES
jgi:hypothetical protein